MKVHQFSVDDLDAVLVSEGPGSYTGLRIAASGVKGLLFGSEVPLYGVQTLPSFATAALQNDASVSTIHAIIDARRRHVYHQKFKMVEGKIKAKTDVKTIEIQRLEQQFQDQDRLIGTGIDRFDEGARKKVETIGEDGISAKSLIHLFSSSINGDFIQKTSPADFDPKYYT
jgi:tRNA threonylcarbamoyl adenosine modification protein YeaZ